MPPRKQVNGSATSAPMTRSMKRKQEELASAGDEVEQAVKPKRPRHTAPDRDASGSRKRKAPEQDDSEAETESDVASGPKKKQRIDAPKKTRASTRKKPTKGEGNPKASSSRQKKTNDTAATPAVAANNQGAAQISANQAVPAAAPRRSGRVRAQQQQQQQQQSQQSQQYQQAERKTDLIAPEAREWLDMVKKIGCTAFRRYHNKLRNTLDPMSVGQRRKLKTAIRKALAEGKVEGKTTIVLPTNGENGSTSEASPANARLPPPPVDSRSQKIFEQRRKADLQEASRPSRKSAPVVRKTHKSIARDPYMPDYRNLGDFWKPFHHLTFTRTLKLGKMAYKMPADFQMTKSLDIKGKEYVKQPMPKPGSSKVFRFTSWKEDQA